MDQTNNNAAAENPAQEHGKQPPELTPAQKAYKEKYSAQEGAAPGWDAIDEALQRLYPDTEKRHYGTMIKYMLGGKDPLDGISIYDNPQQADLRDSLSIAPYT